jgi:type I restriction enzyme M protein
MGKGILAIVIPDGILTNSSLQYVRDSIEEMFKIIAVVSMPQTAFSATGAGVKSSILFLKKYSEKESNNIQNLKLKLKSDLVSQHNFWQKVKVLENEKKQKTKDLNSLYSKDSQELKDAKAELSKEYTDKLSNLKDEMREFYKTSKEEALKKYDYDIFMAIAEDIGYDAVGKETGKNELEYIAKELKKFIESL